MTNRGGVLMEVRAGLADVMSCEWIADRAVAVYRPDELGGASLDLGGGWAGEDRGWIELAQVNWFDDAALIAAAPHARWQAFMSPDTEQPGCWLAHTPQTGLVEGSHIDHEVTVPVAWADPSARTIHANRQLTRIRAARAVLASDIGSPAELDVLGEPVTLSGLRQAMADPGAHAAELAMAFNDRGLRDAMLAMTASDGSWERLVEAAQAAGRFAAAINQHSIYGPAAVLGVAAWVGGRHGEAAEILRSVPANSPEGGLAGLALLACQRGYPADGLVAAYREMDPAETAAFVGAPPAPGPHTAPAVLVDRWFHHELPYGREAAIAAQVTIGTQVRPTEGRRTAPAQTTAAAVRPVRGPSRGLAR